MIPVVEVKNLSKSFKNKMVLKEVNLEVCEGEALALLGSNGAGKTTLLKTIAGLITQDKGSIAIDGKPRDRASLGLRAKLSYILQENNLQREFTVEEELKTFARLYNIPQERVARCIEEYKLSSFSKAKVQDLSGGMARKVQIIRGLMTNPQIILLDEPSVGLDPDVRRELWELIKTLQHKGMAIILTTHYMEEAEFLCERMAVLNKGEITVTGTVAEIVETANKATSEKVETLEEAFLILAKKEY